MPWNSVVKCMARSQLLDFFREVRTHITRRTRNFSRQFGAAVDNGNQKMFCETNFLNSYVVVEEGEFLRKRNLLSVSRIERHAKQIAQVLDHRARQPRIALDLRRDERILAQRSGKMGLRS